MNHDQRARWVDADCWEGAEGHKCRVGVVDVRVAVLVGVPASHQGSQAPGHRVLLSAGSQEGRSLMILAVITWVLLGAATVGAAARL
jgi:hypothetical protein